MQKNDILIASGPSGNRMRDVIQTGNIVWVAVDEYVDRFDQFLEGINADGSVDFAVASGGGRMNITMDRYNADWSMVDRGWNAHVKAEGRTFATMRDAVETFRSENKGILDQDLPAFVIERDGAPVGPLVVAHVGTQGGPQLLVPALVDQVEVHLAERGQEAEGVLEQQRVAVARAVCGQPSILLADEPTGNLDPETSDRVFGALMDLVRETGLSALIATHNHDLAARMDRIVHLDGGMVTPKT